MTKAKIINKVLNDNVVMYRSRRATSCFFMHTNIYAVCFNIDNGYIDPFSLESLIALIYPQINDGSKIYLMSNLL